MAAGVANSAVGNKAQAMAGGMAAKAQVAAQQAVAKAAEAEAKKQMSNAFSAGISSFRK